MVDLVCWLDDNGTPLLTRHYGTEKDTPTSATIALLSTVAKYSEHGGYQLEHFASDRMRVVFKSFPGGHLLVALVSNMATPESSVRRKLQRIRDAAVMLFGESALDGGPTALKRQLKSIIPLVDRWAGGEVGLDMVQILPLASSERGDLRAGFSSLASSAHVDHVALMIGGRFVVGSADWWSLDPGEVLLIQQLLATQPPALLRDIPLFLPKTSPQVAFRVLTCKLTSDAEVLLLGGPDLELSQLPALAREAFLSLEATLYACATYLPRGCTPSVNFADDIMSFVCIRSDVQQEFRYHKFSSPDGALTSQVNATGRPVLSELHKFMHHVEALVEQHAASQVSAKAQMQTPSEVTDVVLLSEGRCYVAVNSDVFTLFAALEKEVPSTEAPDIARTALQAIQAAASCT